jgi:hypothetical protein
MPLPNPFRKHNSRVEDPKELFIHGLIVDIASQLNTERIESNKDLFKSVLDSAAAGGRIEDHEYFVEKLVQALSSLPEDSKIGEFGTGLVLKRLWDNLEHPPLSYAGNPYKYRMADGSNNNIMFPHIGKASFVSWSIMWKGALIQPRML